MRRRLDESESLVLDVGGLNSVQDENSKWIAEEVNIGDEIKIIITADTAYTPPVIKPKLTEEKILEHKLKHFHQLKEELKDHLQE